jgi:hypothetical protein
MREWTVDSKVELARALVKAIPDLTAGHLYWLDRVVRVFSAGHKFDLKKSDLFDETTLQNFGDTVRIHHGFSAEPFTKDKFEYVLVKVLELGGHDAKLAPKGNPGCDVTLGTTRLSRKPKRTRISSETFCGSASSWNSEKGNGAIASRTSMDCATNSWLISETMTEF